MIKRIGWFSFERHLKPCSCSICFKICCDDEKIGFLLPESKMWNSWRWFYINRIDCVRYIRWAGFWQRRPEK